MKRSIIFIAGVVLLAAGLLAQQTTMPAALTYGLFGAGAVLMVYHYITGLKK